MDAVHRNKSGADLNNLITIKRKGIHPSRNVLNFHFGTGNVRSLKNKANVIYGYITQNKLDACLITETWLKDNEHDKSWTLASDFNSDQLKISIVSRRNKSGGGLALVCRPQT